MNHQPDDSAQGRSPDRQELVDQLLSLQPKLQRFLAATLPVEVSRELRSVTFHQLEALACLPPAGTSMRQFAASVGISGAAATALADRMIRQGLAVRRDDPKDRRTVWLAPTAHAMELVASFRSSQRSSMSRALASLRTDQVAAILDLLRVLVPPESTPP